MGGPTMPKMPFRSKTKKASAADRYWKQVKPTLYNNEIVLVYDQNLNKNVLTPTNQANLQHLSVSSPIKEEFATTLKGSSLQVTPGMPDGFNIRDLAHIRTTGEASTGGE